MVNPAFADSGESTFGETHYCLAKMRNGILFICGSPNQTTQMHQISDELTGYDRFSTPYYGDTALQVARRLRLTESTVMGRKLSSRCLAYLEQHGLPLDLEGRRRDYEMVVTCSDLVIPRNIRGKRIILVQEGMTDPETIAYHVIRRARFLLRWLASTAATGLSDAYDRFCVASEGYKALFVQKGVRPEKVVVTGIPNFDNCAKFRNNNLPLRGYALVCTSDARETLKFDNRKRFIRRAISLANGRQLIFKLHPNEGFGRAKRDIVELAPDALVFTEGSAEEMIANCEVLIPQYSSTAFVGLALGKEVHSYFDSDELRKLMPIQNGAAAKNIARVCREVVATQEEVKRGPSALGGFALLSAQVLLA